MLLVNADVVVCVNVVVCLYVDVNMYMCVDADMRVTMCVGVNVDISSCVCWCDGYMDVKRQEKKKRTHNNRS